MNPTQLFGLFGVRAILVCRRARKSQQVVYPSVRSIVGARADYRFLQVA